MTTASLTSTHLPAGPVRLAWLASVALHGAVLFAPLGLSLWRPATDAAPSLQVRIAAPAKALIAPAPAAQPASAPPAAVRPAVVSAVTPVITAAAAETPAPVSHGAAEPPMAEAPAAAAPIRPATVASAPVTAEPAITARSVEVVHVPPRFDAAYLDNPPPAYPLLARRRGEQGTVIVSVDVGADGRPQHCALHRSSGFPALDEAALTTVRTWRFVPARRGEQTVAETVLVPMPFRLTDSAAADVGTGPRAS